MGLGNWTRRKALLLGVMGLGVPGVSVTSVEVTSTVGFCGSCHEMDAPTKSWQASEHFPANGASPEGAECRDCHIPHWTDPVDMMSVKIRDGVKDVWFHWFPRRDFNQPETYFALKHVAQEHVGDELCLRCHEKVKDRATDVIKGPEGTVEGLHSSEEAKKNRCIVCHKHMGHGFHD